MGCETFLEEEEIESKQFASKPHTMVSIEPITFNGMNINIERNTIRTNQSDKIDALSIPMTQKEFASERAAAQYVGVNTRPDICANVQLLPPGQEQTTPDELKQFKTIVNYLKATRRQKLNFTKLHLPSVLIVAISDASFCNAKGSKSQLGFVISMVDKDDNANIVHYASSR